MASKLISNEKADSQISKTNQELDCLEENIIVAPHSLALLGHIMLLSTQRDFSLISKPGKQPLKRAEETTEEVLLFRKREDFKYITHPESFRMTLVQVSNSGYQAFLAAHTNMGKIRLTFDNAQEHAGSIAECVIEGEDGDITTMVPASLKSMRKTVQDSAEWSREICSKFRDTLNLLEEVHYSCEAAQMTSQEKLEELERQKKDLSFEKELAESDKQEKQKKIEVIEKHMDKEREAFLKDFQESLKGFTEFKKDLITEKAEKISKVNTAIECEKIILNKKEENMKLNHARGIEDRNKSIEKMEALSNKITEALIKMNNIDVKKLDKENIKELLKDSIKHVTELEACWKQLVVFFDGISDVTVVMMGKTIEDFANAAESANLQGNVAEGSSNSLKTFTKKNLMQHAFNAYSHCNGVITVSKSYLKISDTYLMSSIIQLGTLVAIDAEREPEKIRFMTKEIQNRSQMTVHFVKEVIQSAKLVNENEVRMKAVEY